MTARIAGEPVAATVRRYFIRFARRLADGRIEVAVQPALPSESHVLLTNGTVRTLLAGDQTAEPLVVGDRAVLLWLEDETDAQLSNVVALDDPTALTAWLQERKHTGDKPRELDATDLDTPIGAMLERLHRTCIFDIDETAAVSNAQRSLDSSGGEEADPEFWDRLVQEELAFDRRITSYRRFARGLPIHEDEVLLLLREMLERTPTHRLPSGVLEEHEESTDEKNVGKPWTPNQRLQVRLLHVLERWSRATNDPRYRWVNPIAPVRNYAALLYALATCWENAYLPEPKLIAVLRLLFESFITGEAVAGYLLSIDQAEREAALDGLPDDARSLASALVYVALRPGSKWLSHVFDWQTFLVPGIELGVFRADHGCDTAIERLARLHVSLSAIDDRLLELADYVDDAHWCPRIQKDLELDSVDFQPSPFSPPYNLALAVRGIADPLLDPRLVALVRRTFQYKRVPALVVMGPDWRLSVADGKPAHLSLPTNPNLKSTERITMSFLATLEQQRLGLGDIFPGRQAAAS